MRILKILLHILVALSITYSFAEAFLQTGYYDSNGSLPGGCTSSSITSPSDGTPCQTFYTGPVCLIGSEWAFETCSAAENASTVKSGHATLLLKAYK